MSTHIGSCLCGAVAYEIDGDFESFYLCHCDHCRKDSGSAHSANLFSSTASLKWLRGENKVTRFTLPSTRHSRSFCSICGSAAPDGRRSACGASGEPGQRRLDPPQRPPFHCKQGQLGSGAGGHSFRRKVARMRGVPYEAAQPRLSTVRTGNSRQTVLWRSVST